MKPSFVSRTINVFFVTLAVDVLFFALFRRYFSAKNAVVLSAMVSVVIVVIGMTLVSHRRKRFGLRKREVWHMEQCMRALFFASKDCSFEFAFLLIQKACPSAVKNESWIETKKQQILPMFFEKQVSAKLLSEKLRTAPNTNKEKVVLGISFDDDCVGFGAKLLEAPEVYALFKRYGIFPKVAEVKQERKKRFVFFDRSKILRYIALAVLFYFSGRFLGYKQLYFLFAVVCLCLAFFSLFAKRPEERFVLE